VLDGRSPEVPDGLEKGYYLAPTIFDKVTEDMSVGREEIFGPVVTLYVYDDDNYEATLQLCESTSPYGLTGSLFATDRDAITTAETILRYSAGNFYINDKPTGSVVGRQPFGGARRSGTNDKTGLWLSLLRWVNPRTIKESTILTYHWERDFIEYAQEG